MAANGAVPNQDAQTGSLRKPMFSPWLHVARRTMKGATEGSKKLETLEETKSKEPIEGSHFQILAPLSNAEELMKEENMEIPRIQEAVIEEDLVNHSSSNTGGQVGRVDCRKQTKKQKIPEAPMIESPNTSFTATQAMQSMHIAPTTHDARNRPQVKPCNSGSSQNPRMALGHKVKPLTTLSCKTNNNHNRQSQPCQQWYHVSSSQSHSVDD